MKKAWHKPTMQLLDARATAAFNNPNRTNFNRTANNTSGAMITTDIDAFASDPNRNGDLGEGSETATNTYGTGAHHPQYDAPGAPKFTSHFS